MIKLLRHIQDIPEKKMVWMIGNFDGVHRGHQALIDMAKRHACDGASLGLLTFEPHPRRFFNPDAPIIRVQQFSQKLKALNHYGVDYCYAYKFDQAFADMSAESFCRDILAQHLYPSTIIVGHDFCFGKGRVGSPEYLISAGRKYDFDVCVVSEKMHMGQRFSSRALRDFISEGKIEGIKSFLGRDYILSGRVIKGRQLARQLGFPTANIAPAHVLYPMNGVYSGYVLLPNKGRLPAIVNIGTKPTVTDDKKKLIEVHIPNFSQDLYGEKISFSFHKFIRPEMKFSSLMNLKRKLLKISKRFNILFSNCVLIIIVLKL